MNAEFKIAVKIRINAPLHFLSPSQCICGDNLDDFGFHLFKCRIGGEWDARHSSLVHCIASIIRSTEIAVQHKVPLANLGPLQSIDRNGTG